MTKTTKQKTNLKKTKKYYNAENACVRIMFKSAFMSSCIWILSVNCKVERATGFVP